MRPALAILLVVVPTLAAARPAKPAKLRLTTSVTANVDEDEAMTAAVGDALHAKRTKLDGCWRKPATAKARIVFDKGKVTAVELTDKPDPRAAACITRALRTTRLASTLRVIATVELEARSPQAIDHILNTTSLNLGKLTKPAPTTGIGGGGNTLSSDEIHRVVKARARDVRSCYQNELAQHPKLAGKVVVRFVINGDGTVRRAAVTSSTLGSNKVERCIVAAVQRMRFRSSGGMSTVSYPFLFASN